MYQFIAKLIEIFKTKKRIFAKLKESTKPIAQIVRGIKVVVDIEIQEQIIKHHTFREDTGLLPLIESLIKANNELVHYQNDEDKVSIRDEFGINMSKNLAQCGLTIHRTYREMMSLVEKEQYFLVRFFEPTLRGMQAKEKYKESWVRALDHFGNLLEVLDADLEYFYILLEELKERGFLGETVEVRNKNRAIIKNNVIVSIQSNDFAHARYWINYGKNMEWFNEDELKVLNDLIFFIEQHDGYQLEQVIENEIFKKIFNQKEIEFFKNIAEKLIVEIEIKINPAQLAEALAKEAEQWDLIKKELPEIKVPIPIDKGLIKEEFPQIKSPITIDKMPEIIEEALEAVEEVAPEVEEVPEVKKFKKARMRRLRARFRLAKIKAKKWPHTKREAITNGWKILNRSIRLRKKLWNIRLIRLRKRLNEEYGKLSYLIRQIATIEVKFPDFSQPLSQIKVEVQKMLSNIENFIRTIINIEPLKETGRKTFTNIQQFLSSISIRRESIEDFVNNLGKPGISRRQLLRGLGIAGIAAAVGGSEALLARKKPEIKAKEELKKEIPQPKKVEELDLKFDPVAIPEVNKTIYTEGSYKNATYIVVIPHSTELNALIAARQECRGPITYVAGNNDRNLKITVIGRKYQIDPNRAFCTPGIVDCFQEVNGKSFNGLRNDE